MGDRQVRLLDCTIRDGGYYNDWDFDIAQVQEYIDDLVLGGIKIIEIGFRFTSKKRFLGPFAYTSEETLADLNLPEDVVFGVMLNATDFLHDNWQELIDERFVAAKDSKVKLVRIAAHLGQVTECNNLVAYLKKLGYMVGLNIMQISQASDAEITSIVEEVEQHFVDFEALYFADSLGNLTSDDVKRIVGLMRAASAKEIGFHGHDNIGLGVSNSLTAIEAGATWIDATVTGMGRGAGNTQTEYLVSELQKRNIANFHAIHIEKTATGRLKKLKEECGWGTNLFYYKAGLASLHPTYVQQMISSQKYEPIDILLMIEALGSSDAATSYSEASIESAIAGMLDNAQGGDNIHTLWQGRPVILVAGGPNAKRHWCKIARYAKSRNAVVLAVNYVGFANASDIDAVAAIHPARLMHVLESNAWNNVELFTSSSAMPREIQEILAKRKALKDYGVKVEADTLDIGHTGCVIPDPLCMVYAGCLAIAAGASEILFAGFDGYDGKSSVFHESNNALRYMQDNTDVVMSSLTRTYFDLPSTSIYEAS